MTHDPFLAACPIRGAKDGVVRLTTWPEYETPSADGGTAFDDNRLRFPRRAWHRIPFAATRSELPTNDAITTSLLAAEWPGVRFELPAVSQTPRLPDPGAVDQIRHVMRAMERVWAEQHHEGD